MTNTKKMCAGALALGFILCAAGCREPDPDIVQAESALISVTETKYWPADATKGSQFAGAMAVDGGRLLVGSRYGYVGSVYTGTAYIFERAGTTWSQKAKLSASDGAKNDNFGWFLDLDGDVAVVGAYNKGAAYIFERNSTSGVWQQKKKLTDPAGGNSNHFGAGVSTDSSTVVSGAYLKNNMRGVSYVYARAGTSWGQVQELTASDGTSYDQFGVSSDVEGNTIVVGAVVDDHKAIDAGSVYVFMRSGTSWSQTQKITADDALIYAQFGWTVRLDGDTLLVGAKQDFNYSGAAYVFSRSGTVWSPQAKLTATVRTKDDDFGHAIDLDGDTAIIGSPWDDDRGSASGSAYIYNRSGSAWSLLGKLTASDGDASDFYGEAVAISGINAAVGARGDEYTLGFNAGTLYAYQVSGYAATCTSGSTCPSGFCVDGYCCDTACGGGVAGDCQACSKTAGAAANGTCGPVAAATVCRVASGACDTAETCDGTATACPADVKKASGLVCRAKAGDCDKQETCDGVAAACPSQAFLPAATVCRAATGGCDKAENCTGASATCPADKVEAAATVCRGSAGTCDLAEVCDGTNKSCPADGYAAGGTVCRASGGVCDPAETCLGTSATCPGDLVSPVGTVCRAATGDCDLQEVCDGAKKACPTDLVLAKGILCRAVAGLCDVAEACDGATKACPLNAYAPPSTVCRAAAGTCDYKEVCTGGSANCPADVYRPYGQTCRPAQTECDWEETCKGSLPSCPQDFFKPTGTPCAGGAGQCASGKCWLPPDGGPVDGGVKKDAKTDAKPDLQTKYDLPKKWDTNKVDLPKGKVDLNKDLLKTPDMNKGKVDLNKDLLKKPDMYKGKVDLNKDLLKTPDMNKGKVDLNKDLLKKKDLARAQVDLNKDLLEKKDIYKKTDRGNKIDMNKDLLEKQDGFKKQDGLKKWDTKKQDGLKKKPDTGWVKPPPIDLVDEEGGLLCNVAPAQGTPPWFLLLFLVPLLRRRTRR